jgi:hypothetical protein
MTRGWWACPNVPPCPHPGVVHDIDEPGGREQCCMEGCGCGRPPLNPEPPLHPEPEGWRDRDFIDFPTGWWLADLVEHPNPLCSYAQTAGALLCDCGAIEAEWRRRTGRP